VLDSTKEKGTRKVAEAAKAPASEGGRYEDKTRTRAAAVSNAAGVRVIWGWLGQGEAEEARGVVIADVFDHRADEIFAVR